MATGLGTFDGSAVALKSGGAVGGLASATVSQSINTTDRTVTITVTGYAGYKRMSGGNWSVSQGTAFWGTAHADAYLKVTIDGQTASITNKIGVASSKSQTVTTGTVCTIPNGKAQARSGYSAQKSYSRTFSYGTSGSAITKSWSVTIHEYGNDSYNSGWHDFSVSGSVTTDAIGVEPIAPSGAGVSLTGRTYNSVNIKSTVSSWGQGYSGTPNLEQIVVAGSATSSNWQNTGRQVKQNATSSMSSEQSVTNSNSIAYSGGMSIKGATPFKIAAWASTSVGSTSYFDDTTYYTPPAPLSSLTYTQTQNSTNVTIGVSITGNSSTNNSNNNVTTQYRYSTNGGSSYSDWTSIPGAATAWTNKTASFTCNYGASVVIQARQMYQYQYSEVKQVSFTATNGTAPSAGSLAVTGSTWNSVTLTASNVNYGKPDGVSGRKLAIGVHAYNDTTTKRENQVENVTSATTTVNNNSIYPSGTALNLKGMADVYPYLWVWNTKQSAYVVNQTSAYYLPPAPGVVSYTDDFHGDYTIRYTGNPSNNVSGYTVSELKRTVRYKIDDGNWVYVDNDATKTLEAITSEQIHVPYQSTAVIEAWMTYRGKNSEVSSFSITNTVKDLKLYGSVNGVSENIEHLYGSVNGLSKKVVKLYGSVGGVATEVYRDE
jgi:hypothetical protein